MAFLSCPAFFMPDEKKAAPHKDRLTAKNHIAVLPEKNPPVPGWAGGKMIILFHARYCNGCINISLVINSVNAEAEKLGEILAISGEIGVGVKIVGGYLLPESIDFLLDISLHFAIVHADTSLGIGAALAAVKVGTEQPAQRLPLTPT